MSAETIKMPEPIIDPMTRVVALVRPGLYEAAGWGAGSGRVCDGKIVSNLLTQAVLDRIGISRNLPKCADKGVKNPRSGAGGGDESEITARYRHRVDYG